MELEKEPGGTYPGGLTKFGWYNLIPKERIIQYKRYPPCPCEVHEELWPEPLFEAYSFDPYIHTSHSPLHSIEKFFAGTCECNQCLAGIGIQRDKLRQEKQK